jgi:hypothetical protein
MKLKLFFVASLLTSGAVFGQFTQANEPTIGTTKTMYVVDSNAVDYAATTGTGVTWDYSTIGGYGAAANKIVAVTNPSGTTYFSSSQKAIEIPGFITGYYTSTASSRVSQGFHFSDPNSGMSADVVFDASPNDQTVMNYPFAQSNTLTDTYSGNVHSSMSPSIPFACTGSITATVDGSGTLKLEGQNITNVLRYKVDETATANIPGFGTLTVHRIQYDYYDLANSTLPIFVHSSMEINIGGTPSTNHLVMSSVLPTGTAGISSNNSVEFTMFPNPATEKVSFTGLTGSETVQLVDLAGKVVYSTNSVVSNSIDVSAIEAGIYNVVVISNGNKTVKKLTVQ